MRHLFLTGTCIVALMACSSYAASTAEKPQPQRTINPERLAQNLEQSGNPDAAAAILRGKTRKPDATAADYLEAAASMRKMGAHGEAAGTLRDANSKFPSDTEIIRQLGIALIASGQPVEAVGVFDMLAAMQPKNAMAYNGKAVAFDTAGNHVAALEIYEKALSLEPQSVAIRNNMALSMVLNEQVDEGIELLEALYKESNAHPKVRHNLALAYGLKGNRQRALELGLKDLTKEQAEENLRFYQQYATKKNDVRPVDLLEEDGHSLDDLFKEVAEEHPKPAPKTPQVASTPEIPVEAAPSAGETAEIEDPAEEKGILAPFFGRDAEYSYPGR